jgi:thiol-disulfide isomerase/thioredoxin
MPRRGAARRSRSQSSITVVVWFAAAVAAHVGSLGPRKASDVAPAAALRPVDAGGPTSLAALRDRVVLLDFWATWCAPCRRGMPAIERLWERYRDQGLEIVSINIENDAARARAFAAAFQPRLTFPLYLDDGALQSAFHVDGICFMVPSVCGSWLGPRRRPERLPGRSCRRPPGRAPAHLRVARSSSRAASWFFASSPPGGGVASARRSARTASGSGDGMARG